jgi:hypothetical protein
VSVDWREVILCVMGYLDWKEFAPNVDDLAALPDEQLRTLFLLAHGYTQGSTYRRARAQVVRELAGLEK